jgi:hypothetical protein
MNNKGFSFLICICLIDMLFLPGLVKTAWAEDDSSAVSKDEKLPPLHQDIPDYRTPRAGEGFRAEIFGREITVEPRDRRSSLAMDIGLAFYKPLPEVRQVIPWGAFYIWRHPNDQELFRAVIVGVYNDIFWAHASKNMDPFELVATFNNYTIPLAQAELVDGRANKNEELLWGYVRPGFGLGYRRTVSPGHQDNMMAIDATVEPGYLFFDKGSKTARNFVVPADTFELREHLQFRWDALERNILSLPHEGFAFGGDLVHGNRSDWRNWGINGSQPSDGGRDYLSFTGYIMKAGGVPGFDSDRHRLLAAVYGGTGSNLDRFSAPRIGGGDMPMGEEYGSTSQAVLPGAVFQEYFPKHYLLAIGEYRWEALFFTYLSLDASAGWLDRLRQTGPDITDTTSKTDFFSSLGARLTTGFFFDSRMQFAYNYNFSEIRKDGRGGHEIVLHFSRDF